MIPHPPLPFFFFFFFFFFFLGLRFKVSGLFGLD